ncbi:MAG: tetratricopeptide repeat protein, partial [Acidobacteriota bacterium]
MSPRRRLAGLAAAAALLAAATAAPAFEPVSHPVLTTAEPEVRRQLERERRVLDAALVDDPAPAAAAAAYGALGEIYQAYDLLDAAAGCYRNALAAVPGEPRWTHLLGVVERLEGRLEDAAERFRAVVEREPENLAAWLHRAAVELELGRRDAARRSAEAALALDGGSAAAYLTLGRVARADGDHGLAAERFERALEIEPGAKRLHYLAGLARRRTGDLDAARRHLAQQGPGEPGFADPRLVSVYASLRGSAALMQRGAKAEVAGQMEASISIYRRAVEVAPESPEARRDLGALLTRAGRPQEALEHYREAVRLEGDRGLNHFEHQAQHEM